jgi:hypothetical protein
VDFLNGGKFIVTSNVRVPPNLIIRLHRWASRQDENFTTETFVFLLEYLMDREPEIAIDLLDRLTGSQGIFGKDVAQVEINTQQRAENMIPDIWIESQETLVLVEVKVTSYLGAGQVQSYRGLLEKHFDQRKKQLVVLTRYPVFGTTYDDVLYVRWHQIAQWLEEYLQNVTLGEVNRYQIEQFLEFLRWQGAAPLQVRSDLSQAIANYQARNVAESVFSRRIRSLSLLQTIPGLSPLYNLLLLMDEAIAGMALPRPAKFDSGQPTKQEAGWIGYNLNQMEYFYFLFLDHPERIVFEIMRRKIIVEEVELGRLENRFGGLVWFHELNLNDPAVDFFKGKNKAYQLKILEDFLRESLCYAETISQSMNEFIA